MQFGKWVVWKGPARDRDLDETAGCRRAHPDCLASGLQRSTGPAPQLPYSWRHSRSRLDESLVHHIHRTGPGQAVKLRQPSRNLSNSLHTRCGIAHSTRLGSPGTWPPEADASVGTSRRHEQMIEVLNFQPRKEKASWAEGERMRSCPLKTWWTLSTGILLYSPKCDGQ